MEICQEWKNKQQHREAPFRQRSAQPLYHPSKRQSSCGQQRSCKPDVFVACKEKEPKWNKPEHDVPQPFVKGERAAVTPMDKNEDSQAYGQDSVINRWSVANPVSKI